MLKQYDPQTAKQTILKRTPPDEFSVSPRVQDGITQLFGEPLTPDQAVSRILKDVRTERRLCPSNLDSHARWPGSSSLLPFPKIRSSLRWIPFPPHNAQALEAGRGAHRSLPSPPAAYRPGSRTSWAARLGRSSVRSSVWDCMCRAERLPCPRAY